MPYTSSNTTTTNNSSTTAPHRKNAALRSESPYQQRTSQKDNPTQQLIKQAVDFLIQQLEAGKSETLTAYLAQWPGSIPILLGTFSPLRDNARQLRE
jgi:hypothetical protein